MPLQPTEIKQIFQQIKHLKVGVIGDFAVDYYYEINKQTEEFSIETGKEVHWGKKPKTSLGAAGNVVQNLAALGINDIQVFGCVGNDVYGREMQYLLQKINVDTANLKCLSENWDTCTYTKPISVNGEENRLDFGTHNELSAEVFDEILQNLDLALPSLNILIINQQFPNPLLTPQRIEQLNTLFSKHSNCLYVADLRSFGLSIKNVILKVNTEELARLVSIENLEEANELACIEQGKALLASIGGSLLVTRGEYGITYISANETQTIEALKLNTELDTVGAGDTVVASFSASRGTGTSITNSLEIANLAAAVTVQKLHQTGTATLEEILNLM